MSQVIGQTVGNLEIVSKIASGGMGTVYRAEHQTLRTPYAVKVLHPRFSEDHTTAERFRREAVTCSKLRHPNVVFVTDFGFHDELGIYLIMEFLEGDPLSTALKKQPRMPLGRMAKVGEQICDALEAAHAMGIVHRDLKPDNIFIVKNTSRRDYTKVLDFGIAQIQQGEGVEKLTRAGLVLGTPAYISPEQINGQAAEVGPGADIYALGAIFYEMVCGAPPFTEGTDFEILSQHMFKAAKPLSAHRPDLADTSLEKLILKMLGKKPEERPLSMVEVHAGLSEAIGELQELGIQDAFYRRPSSGGDKPRLGPDTGQFSASMTPPPLRITNVIQHIKTNSPNSAVATLIGAFPGMATLQEEIFHMALWGVLHRELLDHPLDSSAFKHATEQFTLFAQAVLNAADSEDGPDPTRLFRSIEDLFTLADATRQEPLVMALQPLTTHHLFPMKILPEWARPKSTGTWQAFKSIMTSEIKLPFGRPKLKVEATSPPPSPDPPAAPAPVAKAPARPDKPPEPPTTRPTAPPAAVQQLQAAQAQPSGPDPINEAIANPGPPLDEAGVNERRPRPSKIIRRNVVIPQDSFSTSAPSAPPAPERRAVAPHTPEPQEAEPPPDSELNPGDGGYESSLAYKLNQDMSVKNIKNIFSHEISFFKRKKKKKGDEKDEE